MKRIYVVIDGKPATLDDIREADRCASREFSAAGRPPKPDGPKRKHRKQTPEQKAAKQQQIARKKILAQIDREEKDRVRLQRRIAALHRKDAREEAKRRAIVMTYRPGREPKFTVVCPKALFRRTHPHAPKMPKKPARTAQDGMRNLVYRFTGRGFGAQDRKNRPYKTGEAGRCARYIARPDGLEEAEAAVFTNILGYGLVAAPTFSVEEQQEIVGFLDALEALEKATGPSHVYTHTIIALPFEAGTGGRSDIVRRICAPYVDMGLPFVAAMHKPDPEGDQRNFHLHIVHGTRPFEREGQYSWSFSPDQCSEFINTDGKIWARHQCAEAFNAGLAQLGSDITYTAVSEADRGLEPRSDSHKGQKKVALERAAAADELVVDGILAGMAHHALALIERFAELKRRKARKREMEQVQPGPVELHQGREAATMHAALDEPVHSNATAVQIQELWEARAERIGRTQFIIDNSSFTEGVQTLIKEVKKHPQTFAVALYNHNLQFAYEDRHIEGAIREAVKHPTVMNWLRYIAEEVEFDHAGVPATWHEISLGHGEMIFPLRATTWAGTHGKLTSQDDGRPVGGWGKNTGRDI